MRTAIRFATSLLIAATISSAALAQSDTGLRIGGRDFRQGDEGFTRHQRILNGTDLRTRTRLGRSERIREQRQDRSDAARWRRGSGQIDVGDQGFGERIDNGSARRLDRASQSERAAQKRALEIRNEMLARQRAEREKPSPERNGE